jgi:uncharacterized protein (TIGR00288 family)
MNTPTDTRSTRIAVFIDFDNVEIGVKSTIGGQFDIGLVLEAIKERGEIVTKIAYSDWKRVGDYSRLLTQHAIRMVQRNMTPGGDKNGADITMALDALEMCFTHDHINAFVIVGGDSDFISLVEKLKQYGRKVIVVGGRQFTSVTMQRNCHEFIAYENLVGSSHRTSGRGAERGGRPAAADKSDISKALPLIKRALKVLSEREVAPQLGLLKSTLLQLDSTFSEREYGAGSFRDFMEKVAQTGAVTLKQAGRSMLVESREGDGADVVVDAEPQERHEARRDERQPEAPRAAAHQPGIPTDEDEESLPPSPMSMQDGIRAVQQAFAGNTRWPMYVRQAKQVLRTAIEGFDERKYGFASVVDLLRAAGKEGVLRIERDRQGAVRVFPGANMQRQEPLRVEEPTEDEAVEGVAEPIVAEAPAEMVEDTPIVDAETIDVTPEPESQTTAKKRARARKTAGRNAKPKGASKAAKPRARKPARAKATAADAGQS